MSFEDTEEPLSSGYNPRAALTAANERIRVLEADAEKAGAVVLNINADRIALRKQLTAEREVSDKLERALKVLVDTPVVYMGGAHGSEHQFYSRIGEARDAARATLAEVAAIRAPKP